MKTVFQTWWLTDYTDSTVYPHVPRASFDVDKSTVLKKYTVERLPTEIRKSLRFKYIGIKFLTGDEIVHGHMDYDIEQLYEINWVSYSPDSLITKLSMPSFDLRMELDNWYPDTKLYDYNPWEKTKCLL